MFDAEHNYVETGANVETGVLARLCGAAAPRSYSTLRKQLCDQRRLSSFVITSLRAAKARDLLLASGPPNGLSTLTPRFQ